MDFLINSEELAVLGGLPHIQQLTYLRGIRPYMDVKTGLVGVKRGISHQSISEQLYVEPHQGIKSQSFSRDQVRRAVSGLVRAGIIEMQSEGMQLILKCNLASRYFSVQNKAAINPPQKATINPHVEFLENTGLSGCEPLKADIVKPQKAAIPNKENNNYIYLLSQFEKFWSLYPEKKSKQKAQAVFEQLNPNTMLFRQLMESLQHQINHIEAMKVSGLWVPPWKYPANWLAQRCWEDELMEVTQERKHEKHQDNHQHESTKDMFWNPGKEKHDSERNNIVYFQKN